VDLSITYLGLDLPHPLIPGASPLAHDLDQVKRLEDAGAAAIVMHSLFEEQIVHEQLSAVAELDAHAESFAEALSYFPDPSEFALGPDQYLEQIDRIKRATALRVIGSLNGVTAEGWLRYASLIQEAGADALELNVYFLATDPGEDGRAVERRVTDIVSTVAREISIPIAVKLSPFFSSLSHLAGQLATSGAAGLVLFNRFYQPDIDAEELETVPSLHLSDSSELLLRLRWLGILHGHTPLSLAASGGVHEPIDAVKAIMTGATAVQMVSGLLRHGPKRIGQVRDGLERWMVEHEYESVRQMCGSMSLRHTPNPLAFERANYMQVLQGWRSPAGSL
jgi:dihydroorotate dehydrogenase (fumarate)